MPRARVPVSLLTGVFLLAGTLLSACAPTDPGAELVLTPRPQPPALPEAGESYAHRLMTQAGVSFADIESPQDAPQWSKVFGFMPAADAASPDDARSAFDRMVVAALADSLRATDLGSHGIRPEPLVLESEGALPVTSLRFDITGGPCGDFGTRCSYAAPVIDRPGSAPAPAFSGITGEAWWLGSRAFGPAMVSDVAGPVPLFTDLTLWQRVTSRLPDWAFVYLAPGTAAYRNPETGAQEFNPWPLLVQDGCVYRFGPRGSPIRKEPPAHLAHL